jgi:hypothetical protein
MFSYPLIFLAKLAGEGLLHSNLSLIPVHDPPVPLSPLSPSDKLCRLLQLGVDLLERVAPNPHHPAVKQAAFLRRIRDAGISGRRSVISAPGSPRGPPPSHPPQMNGGSTGYSSNGNGQANATMQSYTDFALASSYEPSPMHSPQQPMVDDAFSALLSGVSPSLFDGGQPFFGLEMGFEAVDWDGLERDMGGARPFVPPEF